MTHFQRPASFWWKSGIGAALFALLAIALMFNVSLRHPDDIVKIEAAKILFQFVLVTLMGGLIFAYLNDRRDRDQRAVADREAAQELAAARRTALQEILGDLGDAHRKLKVVKRQMRAHMLRADQDDDGRVDQDYPIRADAFEKAMEALLNAQIAAEEVRDRIAIRTDLLDEERIARIRKALRYGARYFHDVYQDYERCKVRRHEDSYIITSACRNLSNFLLAKQPPRDLPPHQSEALDAQFTVLRNDDRTLEQRYAALKEIEELRGEDSQRRRYRAVATECFALAADEIREAIRSDPPQGAQQLAVLEPIAMKPLAA